MKNPETNSSQTNPDTPTSPVEKWVNVDTGEVTHYPASSEPDFAYTPAYMNTNNGYGPSATPLEVGYYDTNADRKKLSAENISTFTKIGGFILTVAALSRLPDVQETGSTAIESTAAVVQHASEQVGLGGGLAMAAVGTAMLGADAWRKHRAHKK